MTEKKQGFRRTATEIAHLNRVIVGEESDRINRRDLSYKERMEDAQASGAEEGRDKLRKAVGSRK